MTVTEYSQLISLFIGALSAGAFILGCHFGGGNGL